MDIPRARKPRFAPEKTRPRRRNDGPTNHMPRTGAAKKQAVLLGWRDAVAAIALALALAGLFSVSPVHQLTDAQYTIVASEQLLRHGSLALDDVVLPQAPPQTPPERQHHGQPGFPYQVQVLAPTQVAPGQPKVFHWYPPGAMVLSAPIVALAHQWTPYRAIGADNRPDAFGEEHLQGIVAAVVGALYGVVLFVLARTRLSIGPSLVAATLGCLSTMIWSTSTRALWSSTWGVLLLALAWLELAQAHERKREIGPFYLATLLSWAWFCRPSFAVHIALLAGWILWRNRQLGARVAVCGGVWLLLFLAWSHATLGQWLPDYYQHGSVALAEFGMSLASNLASPSRGLFIYAPLTWLVVAQLWSQRHEMQANPLVRLALATCVGHLLLLAVYPCWWGGHAYGARLSVEMLPALTLLGIIAWSSRRPAQSHGPRRVALVSLGAIGIAINAQGAWEDETFAWNVHSPSLAEGPARAVWNWRNPQFLAGILPWPLPDPLPNWPLHSDIAIGQASATPYLQGSWCDGEGQFRWTCGHKAQLAFRVQGGKPSQLTLQAAAFVMPQGQPSIIGQRYEISWNERVIASGVWTDSQPVRQTIAIQDSDRGDHVVLTLRLADANSLYRLGKGADKRFLGLAVSGLRLD